MSKGDVEIAGSFSGEIEADGNVTLRAAATCNIVAGTISMSRGAVIKGTVSMDQA